jgi:integrase
MRNYNKTEPKIYQAKRGRWRVRFFDDEKELYRDKTVETKTEAEAIRRAIDRGDDLSMWFPDNKRVASLPMTFDELSEKWLEHGENVRRISKSCLINYSGHLRNHILPVLGKIKIKQLKLEDVERLAQVINHKKPQTRSYQAIRKSRWDQSEQDGDVLSLNYQRELLTVACMITTWASKRRPSLLLDNPFETFKLPEVPEHLYDYWRLEEEDKFLDWIEAGGYYDQETTRYKKSGKAKTIIKMKIRNSQELRDIVLVGLRTGMRIGEIGALRNMDVDLSAGFIIVRGTFSKKEGVLKNTTKNKKARRIEINSDVREILERKKYLPQNQAIFNIHMNSIKLFSRTCRWAGAKEIHFHSLRHTCLTNLANGYGMIKALPVPKVQQIAGHSDIKTTMRYVHSDIISETASLQWSREDRKKKTEDDPGGSFASVQDNRNSGEDTLEETSDAHPPSADFTGGDVPSIKKGLRLVVS